MKSLIWILATASIMLGATTASALEFSVLGSANVTAEIGDTVTIQIVMTNDSQLSIYGMGASVSEYGANEFVSGEAVMNYLNDICVGPGICFGGLSNLAGGSLAESAIGANGDRVQFALSACLCGVTGTPGLDQGLDFVTGSAMFELNFIAQEDATFLIGTSYQGDGLILGDGTTVYVPDTTFTLNVIPEPGMALLMGFGLAGLSLTRRRE